MRWRNLIISGLVCSIFTAVFVGWTWQPSVEFLAVGKTALVEHPKESPQAVRTSGFGLRELKLAPRFSVSASRPEPEQRKGKTPVELSSTGLDAALATASATLGEHEPPDPCEYLGEEPPEIVFTQEIIDTAADLDHDPRRIYEFVRNGFDYEVYYGSLKGAHETLMQGCGNDCDLASLLVALLRVSGIPARYVYGSVDIPIDKAMTWVGGMIEDANYVAHTLVSFGIPSGTLLSGGGQPIYVRTDHFWVEAWVDYVPHRGAVKEPNAPGDTWIPLDPSFKEYAFYDPNVNIFELVKFDLDGYLSSVQTGDAVDYYMDQIDSYVEQHLPDRYTHEFAKAKGIISQKLNILPGSLPHILRYWDNVEYLLQPIIDPPMEQFRHKVTVTIGSASYQIPLPELSGKRLTVYYVPATSTDASIIASYGGLYETPAGAVNLKPVIRLDGVEQARGGSISFGAEQTLSFELCWPNGQAGTTYPPGSYPPNSAVPQDGAFSKTVKSGEFHSLVFPYASGNGGGLMEMSERLNGRIEDIGKAFLKDGYLDDALTGDFLTLRGKSWYRQVYMAKTMAAAFMQRYFVSDLGGAFVSVLVKVNGSDIDLSGLLIDAPRNQAFVLPTPGEPHNDPNSRDFMLLTGYAASALEHFIWEQKYGPGGVSTVKCLQLAKEQGQNIYDINSSNVDDLLPLVHCSDDVNDAILAAVSQGKEVKVHPNCITHNNWTGCGYAVTDPITGAGRFEISNGAGGFYFWPSDGEGYYWALLVGERSDEVIPNIPSGASWLCVEAHYHIEKIARYLNQLGYEVYGGLPPAARGDTKFVLTCLKVQLFDLFYFIGHGASFIGKAAVTTVDMDTEDKAELLSTGSLTQDEIVLLKTNTDPTVYLVPDKTKEIPWKIVFINACESAMNNSWPVSFGININAIHSECFIGIDGHMPLVTALEKGEDFWEYLVNHPSATIFNDVNEILPNEYVPPYGTWFTPSTPYWDFRP